MKFPNFVRIASVPFIQIVEVNETISIRKEILNHFEDGLAKIISEKLKFSYDRIIPSDRQWGILMSDGNWSGMVGLLQRNETDLIICSLSITEARSSVMDFSYPYVIDSLVFITRPLEKSIDKESFLKPFSAAVWIYFCATILILTLLHTMSFRSKPMNGRFQKTQVYCYRSILRQSPNAPESIADNILRYSWWIFQGILRWSYAAVLLSFLTFPSMTGVRNIPGLANAYRRGEYQCTAYPGTFAADELLKSTDANLKSLGECLKETTGHPDFDVALTNNGMLKRLAYIGRKSKFSDAEAKYFISEDGFFPDYIAIGVKNNFCCKEGLDSTLHSIAASGIYHKLQKDYYRKKTHKMLSNPLSNVTKADSRCLSLVDFQGAFILLASGYSLATLVLLLEVVCQKVKTNLLIKKTEERTKKGTSANDYIRMQYNK